MAKLPSSIKVGAYKLKVVQDINKCKRARKKDRDHYGLTYFGEQVIFINPEQGQDSKADTLLHEILHAVWANAGRSNTSPISEEDTVSVLASGLLDVLRRNPKVVQYLIEGEK